MFILNLACVRYLFWYDGWFSDIKGEKIVSSFSLRLKKKMASYADILFAELVLLFCQEYLSQSSGTPGSLSQSAGSHKLSPICAALLSSGELEKHCARKGSFFVYGYFTRWVFFFLTHL